MRSRLSREITLVLLVKLGVLTGLWWAFFRNDPLPPAPPAEDIARHLLGAPADSAQGATSDDQ